MPFNMGMRCVAELSWLSQVIAERQFWNGTTELLEALKDPAAMARFVSLIGTLIGMKKLACKAGTGAATGAGWAFTAYETADVVLRLYTIKKYLENVTFKSELADAAPIVAKAMVELLGEITFAELMKRIKCFPAGTPVVVAASIDPSTGRPTYETRPIESLRRGDLVLARDEHGQRIRLQPVEAVLEVTTDSLIHLTFETSSGRRATITSTPQHPIWIEEREAFVGANTIQPGEHTTGPCGDRCKFVSSRTEEFTQAHPVYNLTVSEAHTFFVTDADVTLVALVHNTDECVPGKSKSDAPKGIGPDDVIPNGFSFDIDNPRYRRFKSGDQVLEYSRNGGELAIDWIDGGGGASVLRKILAQEGKDVRRIAGYATDKLGELSNEALTRYGRQVARQLGDGWTATIEFDGLKRFLVFTR
ncbi:MAG: Hint domain-containing protein [Planctomycetota bacterium]|nr:Hint domain-containing protein [Planctomycetota bacterium]